MLTDINDQWLLIPVTFSFLDCFLLDNAEKPEIQTNASVNQEHVSENASQETGMTVFNTRSTGFHSTIFGKFQNFLLD